MRKTPFAVVAALGMLCGVSAQTDRVAWEALRADAIAPAAAHAVLEIRRQVQEVLDAGNHLGASFQYYADVPSDGYYQYEQPGRIVMMLAYAYPYLGKTQQEAVRAYVAAELSNASYTPWTNESYLPTANIARRSRFTQRDIWCWDRYWGMQGQNLDNLNGAMLYGLWLYAWRSGDWGRVTSNASQISSRYSALSPGGNLYGTYGMHIAQARMAQRRGDAAAAASAVTALGNRLSEGQSFNTVSTAALAYFGYWNQERLSWGYHFGGMFLYLTSEIGRWLRDGSPALRQAVLARQNEGKAKFPHWWLYRSPVFCRWSGDEGVGVPSEIIGMMFPVERWVAAAPAESLLACTIWNAQNAIGDCHVVEAAVQTVEACGRETWRDVREASFTGPGILVLDGGSAIDERLLTDNPRAQTLTVTWPAKPAYITGSAAGAITGVAPSEPRADSIVAVLWAGAAALDTIRTTVVVLDPSQASVRRPAARAAAGSAGAIAVRGGLGGMVLSVTAGRDGPATISVFSLRGELLWSRPLDCAAGERVSCAMPAFAAQPAVAVLRQHDMTVRRNILVR